MNLDGLRHHMVDELGAAQQLRRTVHSDPELSGSEGATCELILDELQSLSGQYKVVVERVAATGAVVSIDHPSTRGNAVALRAELDALPVSETTGVEWASRSTGVMHACGHDVHLAALVCAARTLAAAGLPAPLTLILQPREESGPSGAVDILSESSLLQNSRAVVAAHVQPTLAPGEVACVSGVVNSSSDTFRITITGKGGHAAYPHLSANPITAAAHMVTALDSASGRFMDPTSTSVVTVSRVEAGTTTNVIPDTAFLAGTIRTSDVADRARLTRHVHDVALAVAVTFGCVAEIELVHGEPPLRNDDLLTRHTASVLAQNGLVVNNTLRSAGADDFAFYGERFPSLMMFVGVAADDNTQGEQRLHAASFLPNTDAVADVTTALLAGYMGASRPAV